MRIDFNAVTLKWFRSFTEPAEVLLLNDPGLWFVRGRNEVEPDLGANGAGKSTAFEAIVWCIYGRTAGGLKNPDIKSWAKKAKPASVLLGVTIDGVLHEITREAVTNGLKIDGKEVGPEAAADLIGLSFEVFINTVMQPQGQPLFFDLTPKDKMQLFTEVLNLHRWEERSTKASAAVRELENLAAEIAGESAGTQVALNQAEELFERAKEASETWEAERSAAAKQAAAILKEKREALARQEPALADADLAADNAGTEAKALRASIAGLLEKAMETRDAHTEASAEIRGYERDGDRLEAEYKKLGEAEDCPTCGQSLEGTNLAKHQADLLKQVKALDKKIEKGVPAAIEQAKERAAEALALAQEQQRSFEGKEQTAVQAASRLRSQVAALKSEIALLQDEQNAEKTNPHTDQVQTLRRRRSQLEVQLRELHSDLEKAEKKTKQTQFWVKGFKDVQLYIIEEVLQELEIATNTALAEVGLHDWQVNYDVEKETKSGTIQRGINVTILSPHNDKAVRWESWSGGEGQRLRIVGALALSQVLLNNAGIVTNLEVLDEPTRHLSKEGVADLCDFLSDRAKQTGKTIFLVDHAAREGAAFAGTVTVVKTAKGSRIEQ